MFDVVRTQVAEQLPAEDPLIAGLDDTLLRKWGRKTAGVSYYRDPLGPPFRHNLIRAQRFVQLSVALPQQGWRGPARMLPIDFTHAPVAKKPKRNAGEKEWAAYRKEQKQRRLSQVGVERISALRQAMDEDPHTRHRALWAVMDGSYTNSTVFKQAPPRTVLIGRTRADTKLYHPPTREPGPRRGRRRVYGELASTPEQLRQNQSVPWQRVPVFAAGKEHTLRIKTIEPLLWRSAGGERRLRLIVIAPLAYRLTKKSKLLYRKPAYLLCTDPQAPLERVLQAYFWRWEIEVNFREEKSLLGVGQAQVRHPEAVEQAPAFGVACYAMLLLAGLQAGAAQGLPQPKWRRGEPKPRPTTMDYLRQLRYELWGEGLNMMNFSGLSDPPSRSHNQEKIAPDMASAIYYASQ